jgi:hypothetical protein
VGRKGLHLLLVGKGGVTYAALHREDVFAVGGSPTRKNFIPSTQLDPEFHFADGVAGSYLLGEPTRQFDRGCGPIETKVYVVEKGCLVRGTHEEF